MLSLLPRFFGSCASEICRVVQEGQLLWQETKLLVDLRAAQAKWSFLCCYEKLVEWLEGWGNSLEMDKMRVRACNVGAAAVVMWQDLVGGAQLPGSVVCAPPLPLVLCRGSGVQLRTQLRPGAVPGQTRPLWV